MNNIRRNLQLVQQKITQICQMIGSSPSAVTLLAVSKTKPVEDILTAYEAGQEAFGENYVQEGVEKIQFCQQHNINLEWHFIGPLQSNKTRLVAEYFDWLQTLDRAKIADRLNEQRSPHKAPLNVLIQVNISNEASKSGIQPGEILDLAKHLENLPHLCLRGLMAIPEPTDDVARQEQVFYQMRVLFEQLQQALPNAQIDTLSMGMTDDMQMAIKCGSTMVRVGTAIFGKRV
ncbi:YggS family pyridoxal phosphate-dependent enzyme [Aggregatibacter actinomycetemcomitans]|uniref:YggS family pyridoxal phosphate-dependent enzyme n=1 Tax=Aggregatibacter actinomycetemcomitans TaxID=714 RepID=UPI0011D5E9D1|nr:YggS family pyridoxal phosphate-dependent enzyme [Aggregatibacter actinomycetemcomitans]QEH48134.1 YggS family pyridoxal phosphate-dependent enzyme [Aggregatibacter actinomycetemcomitans]QEH50131.1 YggS family pyridoxal phosphate-dependent enzyme [Aggregatibacter actinomycetemcomitans]TYA50031.1 YggS family pyridoxal phosphate-dependent enzyme [Aggregatibacter actinomycetemcomitans]TYA51217.1 YggS family pyridoxal phosphate-dependent enzyme [Aggregatibacter actinomycetemcomitans]TYB29422.1 